MPANRSNNDIRKLYKELGFGNALAITDGTRKAIERKINKFRNNKSVFTKTVKKF